jgi:hypothetical protein
VNQKLFLELLVILIIGIRVYYLQQHRVKSIGDKLFALYQARFLKGGWGYLILFYSLIITLILLGASIESFLLGIYALLDLVVIFKLLFSISLRTDDKEEFLSLLITQLVSNITYREARELKEYLKRPKPIFLLYADEFIFFLTTILIIESTGG